MEYNGKIALLKRPAKGLLAKLWSFPEFSDDFKAELEQNGFSIEKSVKKSSAKHIFTHIEWKMKIFLVTLNAIPEKNGFVWVTREELKNEYAIPAAYQGALKAIMEN